MKHKYSFLVVLAWAFVIFPSTGKAQQGFKIGLAAMPQSTWMLNKDDIDLPVDELKFQKTWGMAFGPMVGYGFKDFLGVKFHPLISVQGQKTQSIATVNDSDYVVNHTRKLCYIKLPLMIGINTGTEHAKLIYSFHAGFQASVLMSAKYYNDDETYSPDPELDPNITDWPTTSSTYNFFDYGPVVETGIAIKLAYSLVANLHLRGDYSLRDVEDKTSTYRYTEFGITTTRNFWPEDRVLTRNLNVGIMIGVTYTFTPY